MNKGQAIIYNDWKTLEMKYFYEEEEGKQGVYTFFGNIVNSENFVHFNTKFFSGSKKIEGAKFVFFIGKSALNERYYLIGTYAGSDKYDRAVAGKMILKKYDTKFEMEQEAHNSEFNSLISQELVRKRIVVESNLKRNPLTFSKKSPYAQVLPKITGNYNFIFYVNDLSYSLKICIQKYHYNIISLDNSMIIEEDEIKIINKGQIINLDFSISGMFHLQKLSIYFKSINFINGGEGNFSGIDVNNNIVTGNIIVSEI